MALTREIGYTIPVTRFLTEPAHFGHLRGPTCGPIAAPSAPPSRAKTGAACVPRFSRFKETAAHGPK